MKPLAGLLFFLSGAVGLVYEVCWVRALSLHFGSSFPAVSTVLTVFMGGLALGAWGAGRRAARLTRPLAAYGLVELALAAYAAATPLLFEGGLSLFESLGSGPQAGTGLLTLVRFLVTGILLPPTMLMGATLPLVTQQAALWSGRVGRGAGLFYGLNTTGAFVGTLAAGLVLLPAWGLRATLASAAGLNAAIGLAALAAGRRAGTPAAPSPEDALPAGAGALGAAVAVTGGAIMACEVAWTRALGLILGGSVYTFTVMLATFLLGLGLGAAVAALPRRAPRSSLPFELLALASAVAMSLACALFARLPELFHALFWSWRLDEHPERILRVQMGLSAVLMLGPALLMGGLLPTAIRMAARDARDVGNLYAFNTIGTLAGSFASGFLLIPLLGVRGTLLAAAGAFCAAAVLAALSAGGRRTIRTGATAAAVLVAVAYLTPPWHHQLMTGGIAYGAGAYREVGPDGLEKFYQDNKRLHYYAEGLTATVAVTEGILAYRGELFLSTNGKYDGSSRSDMPTQRLLAHLGMLLHPCPRRVCVVGLGTGCTAGSVTLHPELEEVTAVEIEPEVVEAARLFAAVNHDVHSSPRVRLRVTDGRLLLRLSPGAYDVVISEPSSPWLAGSADLFTVEFFRLGPRALRPRGLFVQWVSLYGMSPENVRTVARTFLEVFPHAMLASTIVGSDVLLVGSAAPLSVDVGALRRRMELPALQADLAPPLVGVGRVEELLARIRLGTAALRAMAGSGTLNTDDRPVVSYTAPADAYRPTSEANEALLALHAAGVAAHLEGLPEGAADRRALYAALAEAYRVFVGPGGESRACEERARP